MSKQEQEQNHVYTGTVAWFNRKRKFGFITPETEDNEDKNDIFVHSDGLEKETITTEDNEEKEVPIKIEEGDKVTFIIGEVEENKSEKPVALDEKLIEKAKKE